MENSMADFKNELDESMRVINEGDMLTGTVVGISDTEVILDLQYYAEGIIHSEDLSADPSFNLKEAINVGDEIKAIVIRMDDGNGNILLSAKKASDILAWESFEKLLEDKTPVTIKIAESVKAGVIGYLQGVRAFIPASKLALEYINNEDLPGFIGKEVEAIVITADKASNKLVLSVRDVLRKKAEEEKAKMISNLEVGFVTEGTVESLMPYGAFVNIGNGVSGLVHISQITNERRLNHPKEFLKEGQTVKVKVTAIKDGKISLSMKSLEEAVPERYREEKVVIPESEELTTNIGALLKNINLDV